mmetsp:Transcript_39023/g.34705  ORF Transcript_39023/g.34705 Transcript_39023/m.34705 type:complete len:81 (+) Transcript_39023:184-426(+)
MMSDDLQGTSLLNHLTQDDFELQQIFTFLKKSDKDIESLALSSLSKKELELDQVFDDLLKSITAEINDMRINIKHHCFKV